MKKLLLSSILLISLLDVQAKKEKINSPEAFRKYVKNHVHETQSSRAKTTAIMWRLQSYSIYADNGSGLEIEDSSKYDYSNARGSMFDYSEMEYYDYGVDPEYNNIKSDLALKYFDAGSGFELSENYVSTYDNANNRLTFLEVTGPMMADTSIEYATYDMSNNILTEIYADRNTANQSWDSTYGYFYTYNGQGQLIEDSTYDYDFADPDTRSTYTYDVNGNLTESIFYGWNSGSWEPSYKALFTYDGNNRITVTTAQVYDNSVWVNSFKDSLGYTGNTDIHTYQAYSAWDTTAKEWVFLSKQERTLNNNDVPVTAISSDWDTMSKQWEIFNEANYTYNSNGDIEYGALYPYINGTKSNSPSTAGYFYYEHYWPVSVKETVVNSALSVYPNPASSHINIISSAAGKVTLYDMAGRAVKQAEIPAAHTPFSLPISGLATGNYILQVGNDGSESYKKLVTIQ